MKNIKSRPSLKRNVNSEPSQSELNKETLVNKKIKHNKNIDDEKPTEKVVTTVTKMAAISGANTRAQLTKSFFNQSSFNLAKALLGKLLVHNINGIVIKSRIVETELYPGGDDKGSISYNGRRTPANEPVFMEAGTTFVYLTYGMYHCINISSADHGGAVLLRAVEPFIGTEQMIVNRTSKLKSKKALKPKELCNGPAKLCIAMAIDKITCNALDLTTSDKLWIETDEQSNIKEDLIVSAKRIGIDRAGQEAVNKLYRFYILGNINVSKQDIEREKECCS